MTYPIKMSLAIDNRTGSLVKLHAERLGVSRGKVLRRAVRLGLVEAALEIRRERAEAEGSVPHVVEACVPGGRWRPMANVCDKREAKELLVTLAAAAPREWKWRTREAQP